MIENLTNACTHHLFAYWLDAIPPPWLVGGPGRTRINGPVMDSPDRAQEWLAENSEAVIAWAGTEGSPPSL